MLPFIALALFGAAVADLPPCAANQLSLGFDEENGTFNGMQQSGTLLVIRNLGPEDCRLPSLPMVIFYDAKGRLLPITRRPPPHMHPGPVMAPVGVAAGAEVTARLRWVSAPAFEHSRCIVATSARISIGSDPVSGDIGATFCTDQGGTAAFDQPQLRPDPVINLRANEKHAARGD